MSLPEFVLSPIPKTVQLDLEALYGREDRYRIFAEKIYPLLVEARRALEQGAYCLDNGRGGVEPVLLMGVGLLQFLDRAPDRQAVELLRYHAGWNLALHRQLGAPAFDRSVLSYFRDRLLEHEQSQVVFDQILKGLADSGLVARRNRQRLDSVQMWGLVRRMSRLECMRESLRLALEELADYPAMGRPAFWTELWEGYVESKLDYRLGAGALRAKMDRAGADAARLLGWLDAPAQQHYGTGPQVQLLRRVLEENFEMATPSPPVQRPAQPPGAVHNPHEPQAQWAAKGHGAQRREHVGYKVQVAETVSQAKLAPGEPTANFITAIVTQPAIGSDEAGMELVDQQQAEGGHLEPPPVRYVDGSYVSAEELAKARQQERQLIGPAQPAPRRDGRFSAEDFDVCVEGRRATCPAGKTSPQCSRLEEEKSGRVSYRFEWSTHCHACPLRDQCVGPGQKHRSLVVGEHHGLLQARRREQKTEAFRLEYRHRAGIEGTASELKRAHGLGRARYRGLAKVTLQNLLIGAACNVKRWIRRRIWELKPNAQPLPLLLPSG
ncbi:MAG TPA: transposase [Candidatus Saccharimonadales bacterium]|nr:transposase [Candidatus Saccharimonadales bacterium]